jgi:hypothetical protein
MEGRFLDPTVVATAARAPHTTVLAIGRVLVGCRLRQSNGRLARGLRVPEAATIEHEKAAVDRDEPEAKGFSDEDPGDPAGEKDWCGCSCALLHVWLFSHPSVRSSV